jgi:hypothetical protein
VEGPFANEEGDPVLVSEFVLGQTNNSDTTDPKLDNYLPTDPNAIIVAPVPFTDAFFDNVDFAGAIPSADADWTAGWTVGLDRNNP